MIIKKLELKNFQVIENFTADFDGNVYFLRGDNELGKSTILKAIGALLTGQRDEILRNDTEKGFAKMIVGNDGEEYEVALSFTKANPRGTLQIKQKNTGFTTENVSMIQKIFGYNDFDAVEFARWSETAEGRRKQIEAVKSMLPQEVRERIKNIDTEVAKTKAERTDVSRDLKTYKTMAQEAAKGLKESDFVEFAQPIDGTEILSIEKDRAALNEKAKTVAAKKTEREAALAEIPQRIEKATKNHENKVNELNAKGESIITEKNNALEKAKRTYEEALKNIQDDAARKIEDLQKEREKENNDFSEIMKVIENDKVDFTVKKNNATAWLANFEKEKATWKNTGFENVKYHNEMAAKVSDYNTKKAKLVEVQTDYNAKDEKIKNLTGERENLIKSAKLPIEGLTFDEDGLVLNGVPFAVGQVSDSQIMEVAVKMIIATNSKTKVFRIARGESLGAKRLNEIVRIAKKNGFQGFIEEVKRGQDELTVEEYTE